MKKNRGFKEAIAAAQTGIVSSDWSVQRNALALFGELVKKDKGFEEALVVAQTGVASSDGSVQRDALELFGELVKKDRGIEEAIAAAQGGILSLNKDLQDSALRLFNRLIENLSRASSENREVRVNELRKALTNLSESTNEEVKSRTLSFLEILPEACE